MKVIIKNLYYFLKLANRCKFEEINKKLRNFFNKV